MKGHRYKGQLQDSWPIPPFASTATIHVEASILALKF